MSDDLKKAGDAISLLTDMMQTASQALIYISKQPALWTPERTPPQQVALECLQAMKDISKGIAGVGEKKTELPVNHLKNGETIKIPKEVNVWFHECCDCHLKHEVTNRWSADGIEMDWKRIDKVPSLEELTEKGEVIH